MLTESLSMPECREADVPGDQLESQPQLLFLDVWFCGVQLSEFPPRLLIGFEMETISSIAEVVLCGSAFEFTAFAVSLWSYSSREDTVAPSSLCIRHCKVNEFRHCFCL